MTGHPGCRLPVTPLSTVAQVRDMASEAAWSRYCNRLLIVNNSLFIHWAHQVTCGWPGRGGGEVEVVHVGRT